MIQLPAEVENLSTRRDKSMKLTFGTLELSASEAMDLFSLQNQAVYLVIKNVPFSKEEVDFIDKLQIDVSDAEKTPSQRIRAVMFLNWKNNPEGYIDFNLYYNFQCERIITHLKSKLPQQ